MLAFIITMTLERTQPQFAKAEGWINPLLERGRKIDAVGENVEAIRAWVVKTRGKRVADEPSIIKHQRTVTRKNHDHTKFIIEATDENDADSVDALGYALSLTVEVTRESESVPKVINIRFSYDPEDPELNELNPNNILFCSLYAEDDKGQTYNAESKPVSQFLPEELESVYGLTNTVAGFIPRTPTTQSP